MDSDPEEGLQLVPRTLRPALPGSLLRPAAVPYLDPVPSEHAAVALAWFRCHERARCTVALRETVRVSRPPPQQGCTLTVHRLCPCGIRAHGPCLTFPGSSVSHAFHGEGCPPPGGTSCCQSGACRDKKFACRDKNSQRSSENQPFGGC